MSKSTCSDLIFFIIFGVPLLLLAQVRDAYQFIVLSYREDVKEFGFGDSKEHIMTEE